MSDTSLQVLPNPQRFQNPSNLGRLESIYDCSCNEKNCIYPASDDDDIENLDTLKIYVQESVTTIDSFLVWDILQAQCHCVNCPLKNLCKF